MNQAPDLDFQLAPHEVDILFHCMRNAPLGNLSYAVVENLMNKLLAQGKPQLDALAVKTDTPDPVDTTDAAA